MQHIIVPLSKWNKAMRMEIQLNRISSKFRKSIYLNNINQLRQFNIYGRF